MQVIVTITVETNDKEILQELDSYLATIKEHQDGIVQVELPGVLDYTVQE